MLDFSNYLDKTNIVIPVRTKSELDMINAGTDINDALYDYLLSQKIDNGIPCGIRFIRVGELHLSFVGYSELSWYETSREYFIAQDFWDINDETQEDLSDMAFDLLF